MIIDEATDEGYDNNIELSDWSFRDTPEKKSFNTSMGNFSAGWTSLNSQLGSDLNSIHEIDATCDKKVEWRMLPTTEQEKRRNPIAWVLDPSTGWNFQLVKKQNFWMLLELYKSLKRFICILVHVKWRATHERMGVLLSIHFRILWLSCITKKKLGRLDVVSHSSDSFDRRIKICKTLEN